ncbi:hypothetical protein B0G81_3652 [Paraburkholderia sp. BL6665CI2N2]|nr:hypothetical protein B0G81_3652 [Paraburkholderia sp. BL6665CI2N2]
MTCKRPPQKTESRRVDLKSPRGASKMVRSLFAAAVPQTQTENVCLKSLCCLTSNCARKAR